MVSANLKNKRGNKKEVLIDETLKDELLGLFLKVKDSPIHVTIKASSLIKEVEHICSMFYRDKNPSEHLENYITEIESDLGWHYAVDLVMTMAYNVFRVQPQKSQKILSLMKNIETAFQKNVYWGNFLRLERKNNDLETTIIALQRQLLIETNKRLKTKRGEININLNVNNQFTGEIKELKVAHADVAVGVAENGSNVYHHKELINGKQ